MWIGSLDLNQKRLIYSSYVVFLILSVPMLVIGGSDTYAFAEEVQTKTNLILGGHHTGSMIKTETVSSDGSIWVLLTITEPVKGERMGVNLTFTDKDGKLLQHVNYDIIITQNDKVILSETMIHQHVGIGNHLTEAQLTDDSVNVQITLQGIGLYPPFTGPQGEVIHVMGTFVIPEFGAIVPVILGIAITTLVIMSRKNKLLFIPNIAK